MVRPMETCSANDDNSDNYNDIGVSNRSVEDNYENNDNDLFIQDGLFNVTHNAEFNGFMQDLRASVRPDKVKV